MKLEYNKKRDFKSLFYFINCTSNVGTQPNIVQTQSMKSGVEPGVYLSCSSFNAAITATIIKEYKTGSICSNVNKTHDSE